MLRLRWTYIDKRQSLNLGLENTRINRTYANGIARQIAEDIRCGEYDVTKNKYRPKLIGNSGLNCSELFDKFTTYKQHDLGISPRSVETRYIPLSRALNKWLDMPAHEVTKDHARHFMSIQSEHVTADTAKARIGLLGSCWKWAIQEELLATDNPWVGLRVALKPQPTQRVKPFNREEIKAILSEFRNNRYYSHYSDFVIFLFGVGCRFGEAAGLLWKHIADDFQTVWIGESVSRGYRKSTKTGKARTIVLSPNVQSMLKARYERLKPNLEDLVFPSPQGLPICDRSFRRRAWKTVLIKCGIEYRKPYAIRHSAVSHALASGADPISVAEQSGHDKRVMLESYAHVIQPQSVFIEF
ncbi:hypothetical protein AM10699_48900 [Acaryochloris marina MBIC10699]|nr:hypothetical protein AM10699_48900 [Acaryochloris marina MBIC10699]